MNGAMMKAVIVKNNETQAKLAEALGMPVSALNARINGHVEFRRNEINEIRKRYNMSKDETIAVFFDQDVS